MQSTLFSRVLFKQLLFFAAGMLAYLILIILLPHTSQTSVFEPAQPVAGSKLPLFWRVYVGFASLLHLPAVQVVAFLAFLLLAWLQRERRNSWLYAALAGFGLLGIFRLLL